VKTAEEKITEARRILKLARENEERSPNADNVRVRESCEASLNYLIDNYAENSLRSS
jgi:hypothetical protein